ncbi:MAG: phthalate 4,5-dioxygenase reductase subunit [Herbaspirillum sp.]|nr:phthalate 4,5-dioxygenase reductase subunit [Herbaspirillum sp.]
MSITEMTGTTEPRQADATAMSLEVLAKTEIAQDIFLFELAQSDRSDLPPFGAGSHLLVTAPNGMARRYSLCNAPSERRRYAIAVKRDAAGGGGSISMADEVMAGDVLEVSAPMNYFPLAAEADSHLLIAGGIGITPALAMMRELMEKNADFKLIYCSRSPETTAFLDELSTPELEGRVLIHHDYGERGRSLDIAPLVAERGAATHLYCCGPRALMEGVRQLTRHWPHAAVHFEDFGAGAHVAPDGERAFKVRLARSGVTVDVPAGVSILGALRDRGIETPSSCESGTCGSCRTGMLSGVAEHRDFVLDDDEQGSEIMICVSRARCDELVLDL